MNADPATVRFMIDELMVRLRPFAERAAHIAGRTSTFHLNAVEETQP